MSRRVGLAILLAIVLWSPGGQAQSTKSLFADTLDSTAVCKRKFPGDIFTHGGYPPETKASIVTNVKALIQNEGCWWAVRPHLFGDTYTPELVDWIVYVNSDGIAERITQRGHNVKDNVLRGEKALNVIFFLERPPATTSQAPVDTFSLVVGPVGGEGTPLGGIKLKVQPKVAPNASVTITVRRDVLQYKRESFVAQLVAGFGGKLFGAGPGLPDDAGLKDSAVVIELRDLGPINGEKDQSVHLFIGRGKVPIGGEMWGRLVIDSVPDPRMHERLSVLTNFANTDRSRFGLSVGVGVLPWAPRSVRKKTQRIVSHPPDSVSSGTTPDTISVIAQPDDTVFGYAPTARVVEADSYLLLHWHAWPRRPWPLRRSLLGATKGVFWYESASMFVGANLLKHDIASRIPVGFSFDRLWYSDFGLSLGVVVLKDERYRSPSKAPSVARRVFPFAGVTLAL